MADVELKFHNELDSSRDSTANVESFYDNWAGKYDDILTSNLTMINEYVAGRFAEYISDKENTIILDVPCGTGITGDAIRKHGIKNIDGSDLSEGMLKAARSKNIYSKLFKSCISETSNLDCSSDTYDGLICALGITRGHLQLNHALREFIRVVKLNCVIAFTVNLSIPLKEIMAELSDLVNKELIEILLFEKRDYYKKRGENHQCHFGVIRRIK